MTQPYRIVVGYDYSSIANLALTQAFEAASKEALAEVHVLNVLTIGLDISPTEGALQTGLSQAMNDAYVNVQAQAVQLMTTWQATTQKSFARLVAHVRYEYPAREIAQLASDLGANLVVVGSHGRRGFDHFLMGSVSEGVIRLAPCPVLVVRPQVSATEGPAIAPPCPECVAVRRASGGKDFWCEQHRERHGQRHTYHYESRVAQPTNPSLVLR